MWGDGEIGRVKVRMNPDAWMAMHRDGSDPTVELGRRGLDTLRTQHGMDEEEIRYVATDPFYQQSCREQYYEAKAKRALPGKIVLHFTLPGTRTPRLNPRPDGVAEGA